MIRGTTKKFLCGKAPDRLKGAMNVFQRKFNSLFQVQKQLYSQNVAGFEPLISGLAIHLSRQKLIRVNIASNPVSIMFYLPA